MSAQWESIDSFFPSLLQCTWDLWDPGIREFLVRHNIPAVPVDLSHRFFHLPLDPQVDLRALDSLVVPTVQYFQVLQQVLVYQLVQKVHQDRMLHFSRYLQDDLEHQGLLSYHLHL